jgi:hypothetical protein
LKLLLDLIFLPLAETSLISKNSFWQYALLRLLYILFAMCKISIEPPTPHAEQFSKTSIAIFILPPFLKMAILPAYYVIIATSKIDNSPICFYCQKQNRRKNMCLLETVKPEEAAGTVQRLYSEAEKIFGKVPNVLQMYSANPPRPKRRNTGTATTAASRNTTASPSPPCMRTSGVDYAAPLFRPRAPGQER